MFDGSSGYQASTVEHEDHLPVETCCAWAKKLEADPANSADAADIAELKQACPADTVKDTVSWDFLAG